MSKLGSLRDLSVETICMGKVIPGSKGRKEVDKHRERLYTPQTMSLHRNWRKESSRITFIGNQVSFNLVTVA
jgi:hypothetical protein